MQKVSTLKGWLTLVLVLVIANINAIAESAPPPPPVQAVVIQPNPIPMSICNGDTITFVAGDPNANLTTYQWNFNGAAAGPQTLFGKSVFFTAGTAGAFTFDLIVSDGIIADTTSFSMTVNPCLPPTIIISGTPTTLCEGTSAAFTDGTVPGSQPITARLWGFPGGVPATSTSTNPTVTYGAAGVYTVYYAVSDINGTYSDTLFDYITVIPCPAPVADFKVVDTTLKCVGGCFSFEDLSLNVDPLTTTWLWSFPGSDSAVSSQQYPTNICYQTPGTYDVTLTVTNPNGSSTETKLAYITVDDCVLPTASYTVEKTLICQGTCVQFFNTSEDEDEVQWTFGLQDSTYTTSESNPIVCYNDTGSFNVQLVAINPYGAGVVNDVNVIQVKPFPRVIAPPDTNVLVGNSIKLIAFGEGLAYKWTPDYEIDCDICAQTLVSPLVNTKYYVTNINEHGCSSTDSVNVVVISQYYRGVPDAFSPNGDEENDVLKVHGNGIREIEFYIYDRNGTQIFESRVQSEGWDGTVNGELMPQGVYAYFAKITYESGYEEILKGTVTLVR